MYSAIWWYSDLGITRNVPRSPALTAGLTFRPPSIAALERLAEAARPALDQLHGEIAETTNLGILDGAPGGAQRRVVGVPAHMCLAAQVGACGHVHCTTLGKAILIKMPHQRVPTMLQTAGMPQTSPFTLAPGVSRERPRRIRKQGYAVDEEANQPHGRCGSSHCQTIASPASGPSKSPAGNTASPGRSPGRCKADPTHPRP